MTDRREPSTAPLRLHWFMPTGGDSRDVLPRGHGRPPSHEYLAQVAGACDQLGFDAVLTPCGTACEDAWLSTASLIPLTRHLRFLVAFRPGLLSPTLAAQMASTYQRMSGGRLLVNIVVGAEPHEVARFGDFSDKDTRYERAGEFLRIMRGAWGDEPFDFSGEHYRVQQATTRVAPEPTPEVFFGGASAAAELVAAQHADVYLTWGETPAMVAERIEHMRALAASAERFAPAPLRFGIRFHVITRDTAEAAWAEAARLLAGMDPDAVAAARADFAGTMSEGRLTIVVVALAILTFLGILSETSLNIAYSTLMGEFSISADVVQWLTTGYLLLLSIAIPTSPFMVRTFPTKGLFVTAVALFSAGTVVGALAVNFPMLLTARLIMALGTGVSLPLLTNIILEKAPFDKRGMMLGLVSLVTCAAPAIGPVFGGLVMEFLNWHWIFYTMIPFLLISLVLGCATVPDIRHGGKGHLSVPSLVLVAAGLAGIIVAASFFAQWNGDWRFWTVLAGAIVVLGVFAAVQLKMEHPLVEVRTFAFPGFTLGMLILLMSSGGVLGVNFLLPILLQRGLGHSSMIAALILLPGAVVGAISAPLIGGALKAQDRKSVV